MKRVISLCLVAIMAVAFVACSMKSEPEKIVDNYYKALQKKDYVTAIKVALGDPIMEGDKELSKEDVKNIAYLIESIRDGKYLITSPQIEAFKKKFENIKKVSVWETENACASFFEE